MPFPQRYEAAANHFSASRHLPSAALPVFWLPRSGLGKFAIRFPVEPPADDRGRHVDGSYSVGDEYFVNVRSRSRELLMLFLLSDVGTDDAPTRIRVGSHLDVAKVLAPAGDAGLSFSDLAGRLGVTAVGPCHGVNPLCKIGRRSQIVRWLKSLDGDS